MLNSKNRAYLKSLAHHLEPVIHIGKAGVSPELTQDIRDVLHKRELVKVNLLKNCFDEPQGVARLLGERTGAEVVQVIGRCVVLYKESTEHKAITLPKK